MCSGGGDVVDAIVICDALWEILGKGIVGVSDSGR
jgi:hypothetical protein